MKPTERGWHSGAECRQGNRICGFVLLRPSRKREGWGSALLFLLFNSACLAKEEEEVPTPNPSRKREVDKAGFRPDAIALRNAAFALVLLSIFV